MIRRESLIFVTAILVCCIFGFLYIRSPIYISHTLEKSDLLSDVETHTVDKSFIFTKKSNVGKWFFDIFNAEIAQCRQN